MALLSQICEEFSGNELKEMSPFITAHILRLARSHREDTGIGRPVQKPMIVRHKLDMQKASHFFSWMFDKGMVQFMSWGTSKLQFTSGEEEQIGRVMLQNTRSNLIRLYLQDCKEANEEGLTEKSFEPLHERTLFKLLEMMKFSKRRAMSGLDNYAVAAADAWKSLQSIVECLQEHGMDKQRSGDLKNSLKASKEYLQGQYLLDVSPETSNCIYHCRRYALSDPAVPELRSTCDDHHHDQQCVNCDLLFNTINTIGKQIGEWDISDESRIVLKHDYDVASNAIYEQMAHVIRGVHQDQAKKNIVETLDEESGFLIFDYAMKWLPSYYRESQSDFFGKKGVSWEVFTLIGNRNGNRIKATYVVFISNCDQNAATSAGIYCQVLREIKKDFPFIKKIYDKSDNAACFRNWKMLRERKKIMEEVGIQILETINNEAQRGKDWADSDIAVIKSQLRSYLNSGHDIETAAEMKKGCDAGSIKYIKSAVMQGHLNRKIDSKAKPPKGPSILSLHSFRYEEQGIRVWHFHRIGDGILIPYKDMPSIQNDQRHCKVDEKFSASTLTPSVLHSGADDQTGNISTVWMYCDVPFCNAKFRSTTRYENHMISADHSKLPTKENTTDLVKRLWSNMQQDITPAKLAFAPGASTSSASDNTTDYSIEGHALKIRRQAKNLSEKQKRFLDKLFWDGQFGITSKAKPADVVKQMKQKRHGSGEKYFLPKEWLTETEISRYFFRLAAAARAQKITGPEEILENTVPNDDDEDEMAETEEAQGDERVLEEAFLERDVFPSSKEVMAIDGTTVDVDDISAEMSRLILEPNDYRSERAQALLLPAPNEKMTRPLTKPKPAQKQCAPTQISQLRSDRSDPDSDGETHNQPSTSTKMVLQSQKTQDNQRAPEKKKVMFLIFYFKN